MHFTGTRQQQQRNVAAANEADVVLEVPALVELTDSVFISKVVDKPEIAKKAPPPGLHPQIASKTTPKKTLLPEVALTDDQASIGTNNWFIRLSNGIF